MNNWSWLDEIQKSLADRTYRPGYQDKLIACIKEMREALKELFYQAAGASDSSTDIPGEEYQSDKLKAAIIGAREALARCAEGKFDGQD